MSPLATLDRALRAGAGEALIKMAHRDLLAQCRGRGQAPEWEMYPLAREFFLQVWP